MSVSLRTCPLLCVDPRAARPAARRGLWGQGPRTQRTEQDEAARPEERDQPVKERQADGQFGGARWAIARRTPGDQRGTSCRVAVRWMPACGPDRLPPLRRTSCRTGSSGAGGSPMISKVAAGSPRRTPGGLRCRAARSLEAAIAARSSSRVPPWERACAFGCGSGGGGTRCGRGCSDDVSPPPLAGGGRGEGAPHATGRPAPPPAPRRPPTRSAALAR